MTRKCKAREEEKTHWCKAEGGGENPSVQSRGGGEDPQGLEARRWPLWRVGRGSDRLGRGQWEWPGRWAVGGRWFFARNLWVFGFMCHFNSRWYILVCVSVFCKLKEADFSCSSWWA
jgi:hypothetical protein